LVYNSHLFLTIDLQISHLFDNVFPPITVILPIHIYMKSDLKNKIDDSYTHLPLLAAIPKLILP
jgi:hypothetical protein